MRRLLVRLLMLSLAALAIVAVVGVWWYQRERSIEVYTDADRIRLPANDATPRDIMWQPAARLPGPINGGGDDFEPHLAPDGRSLLFVRGRVGLDTDLYVTERTTSGWTEPRPLLAINSEADELGPELTRDGTRLYFASNRGGGHGGYDLWVSERGSDGWSAPVNLGPGVNSTDHESGPALAPDGRTVYFASDRPAPVISSGDTPVPPRPPRGDERRDFDLYEGVVTTAGVQDVRRVPRLDSPFHETGPAVSPAGDFLYFASDRPGGAGGFDLYRSRRLDGEPVAPEALGPGVNSPADEIDPAVALGGFQLHFSSNRSADGDDAGNLDLYQSTSREVFADRDVHRATISWDELLPLALWITMLLIAMLLLWILAHAFRSQLFRQLSLIARCLLASLLVHACVLFLMTFWGVGTSVTNWLRDGGGMQVRIASPTLGSVESQVRGSVTDITVNASAETLARAETTPTDAPSATLAAHAAARTEITPTPTPTPATATDARDAPTRPPAPAESSTDTPASSEPAVTLRTPSAPAPARSEEAAAAITATPAPAHAQSQTAPAAPAPASATLTEVATANPLPANTRVTLAAAASAEPAPGSAPPIPAIARDAATQVLDAAPPAIDAAIPGVQTLPTRAERGLVVGAAASTTTPAAAPPVSGAGATPTLHTTDVPAAAVAATPLARRSLGGAAATAPPGSPRPPRPRAALVPTDAGAAIDVALPDAAGSPSAPESTLAVTAFTPAPRGASRSTAAVSAPAQSTTPAAVPLATAVPAPAAFAPASPRTTDASSSPPGSPSSRVVPDLPDAPAPAVAGPAAAESTESFPAEMTPRIAPAAARVTRVPAHETASARDTPRPPVRASRPDAPRARVTPLPTPVPLATTGTTPGLPETTRHAPDLPANTLALEMRLPPVARPRPNPYPQRAPDKRRELVEEMGGSVATERAVSLALDWLARHQSPDGRWHSYDFDDECGACPGAARADVDIALTGLSVLCFLAANHLPDTPGPYRAVVARGIDWLRRQQGEDGNLVSDESMYSHGIATIALAEAYGMTGDRALEEPVRRAAEFIVESANLSAGGWRYAPRQPGDSSVLGWQIMALTSAKRCRIAVDDAGFDVARAWLPRVQSRSRPGLYAYQPNRTVTPAMTAEMMFVRQLLGGRPSQSAMVTSAGYLLRHVPDWEHDTNTYFWYYGTLALYQHQGEAWERWNEIIKDELLAHQETRGAAAGSWPIEGDRWARTGGRVYQTAICTLTLEVYYRYLPLYLDEAPAGR